jgi:hypothetical protein
MRPTLRCHIATAVLAAGLTAPSVVFAAEPMDCRVEEPDSVQISWEQPCQTGNWLLDTQLGCRMWDWHPTPSDGAAWTGACRSGAKLGPGVVQWFENGRPIDRFEGTFVAGRRQGYGRYSWNESDWFAGSYQDDLPDGPGTAHIAGEVFTGVWHHGCFATDRRVVAIGAPRTSCSLPQSLLNAFEGASGSQSGNRRLASQ